MFSYLCRRILRRKYPLVYIFDADFWRPNVILDFVFDDGLIFISVQNIGERPAVKVSVRFAQEIMGIEGKQDIANLPLFQSIEFLAPHKEISTFVDRSDSYFARGQPTNILTNIRFGDMHGNTYNNRIQHNLGIYKDICYVRRTRSMVSKSSTSSTREQGNPTKGGITSYG